MSTQNSMQYMRHLLDELIDILNKENECNWIRGVKALRALLDNPDCERGLLQAQSMYRTLVEGKGTFSDYYIQRAEFADQVPANQRLDEIRKELWQLVRR